MYIYVYIDQFKFMEVENGKCKQQNSNTYPTLDTEFDILDGFDIINLRIESCTQWPHISMLFIRLNACKYVRLQKQRNPWGP